MEYSWISVNERLPEEGIRVILFCSWGVLCDYVYKRSYAGIKGNDFFAPYHSGYSCIRDATHWMPLPSPPIVTEVKCEQ